MNNAADIQAFLDLRARVLVQSSVDARDGLAARRLIHKMKEVAALQDTALVLEASLNAFEQTLLESGDKAMIEATRAKCVATIDSMIRRLTS